MVLTSISSTAFSRIHRFLFNWVWIQWSFFFSHIDNILPFTFKYDTSDIFLLFLVDFIVRLEHISLDTRYKFLFFFFGQESHNPCSLFLCITSIKSIFTDIVLVFFPCCLCFVVWVSDDDDEACLLPPAMTAVNSLTPFSYLYVQVQPVPHEKEK